MSRKASGWSGKASVPPIVDGHLHLITPGMLRSLKNRRWPLRPQVREHLAGEGGWLDERLRALEGVTPRQLAAQWAEAFDQAGVATGFFIAVGEGNEDLAEFVRADPGRFQAWGSVVDPTAPEAAGIVRRFREWGLRGLKLYPVTQRFHAADRALYPLYEAAAEQGLPILLHYGITVAPIYDLTYANPLAISAPAVEFPEITFMIAHCGAGFLREALFLAYHTENIWVDTSGTNNWRLFTPGAPPLGSVFRDLLRAYGPRRIVFGTDSTEPEEYRESIIREQQRMFARLDLSAGDRAAIFGGNARRLFRLEERGGKGGRA